MVTSGKYTTADGKSWPERRRQAPTSIELYQANKQALETAGVDACQMRWALVGEEISFFFRFEDELPVGRLAFVFPLMYPENLIKEGWKKYFLTLDITAENQLFVQARGRFERDGVPLDVEAEFLRAVGHGTGIGRDEIIWTDARNRESSTHAMDDVLVAKFKDGTNKYCRGGDLLRDLSVEGYVAVLTRFVKDMALQRRALKI